MVDGALDLSPAARAAYLDAACGTDTVLRENAVRLVHACERAERSSGVLATPAADFAAPLLADLAARDAERADERRTALLEALRAAVSGRYAVEREVGRGGMATVYLATDLRHDRAVAVKVVERSVAPAGAERFLHEIRTAARLTHPHVLGVHDSGESDGLLYYVMPYVEGETLRARLAREGALPLTDALRLLRELADALSYAHARGIAHCDLKPENVLLSGGHAVVADFGIAKALAAATEDGADPGAGLTSAGGVLGTPAYMAPEQARGDQATDHRADLYALGVLAYEALAGQHPFGGRPRDALVLAHRMEAPPPLGARRPDVPPALAALVMRLLAKDPAARPQSAEDVLRVLEDAATPPAGKTSGRGGALLAVAAALLVVAGVGGYSIWGRTPAMHDLRWVGATRGEPAAGPVAIRAVAVLPFVNTGGSAADEYFSDGVTDEVAHALARLPGLRVAGRTSSYAFKGKAVAAQEVGRALDVGALVGGTVRRTGDRLRVSTQLVSTGDGKVLWDSTFEDRSSDVISVQEQLTRAIVSALAPALGNRAAGVSTMDLRRGTADPEAYDLYLRGRYYWLQRGGENVTRSVAYFRQAIERDPTFARAHAGLAMAYAVLPMYGPDPSDSIAALAEASADSAVALDSTLADAQLAMGVAVDMRLEFRAALARYRTAVELDPSSVTGHHWLGFCLLNLGRTDEALVELRHARELDPLSGTPAGALSTALLFAHRFPESAAAARRALAIDSTLTFTIWTLGMAQAFGGQPDSAVQTLERGMRLHPEDIQLSSGLVFAYAAAGRWTAAARIRARIHALGREPGSGIEGALADLVFGDHEPLVRLLITEAGQRRFIHSGGVFGCDPLFDPLWADERFRAAMRRLTVEPCHLARAWPLPQRPRI